MALCSEGDTFYFKDFEYLGRVLRIFNYRLASWTEFQKPGALDCRGTTYDITDNPQLISLPPQKFFNFAEGGVDHAECIISSAMEKLDGSLISTMLVNGNLHVKSKGSVYSDQSGDAAEYISYHEELRIVLKLLELSGYTVSLEYTAPHNRIVVGYQIPQLRILGIRSLATGEYILPAQIAQVTGVIIPSEYLVSHWFPELIPSDFNEYCKQLQEGEGCVVEMRNPTTGVRYLVKCKADKYVLLHKQKDNVNSPRALFELAAIQGTDDIRSIFGDDKYVQDRITAMENHVFPILNSIESQVSKFYAENKLLERKDYAIKAQCEHPDLMQLMMNTYLGRVVDYPQFLIKRYSEYKPAWATESSEDSVE
jgi:T4 RnlA family RNA ligase